MDLPLVLSLRIQLGEDVRDCARNQPAVGVPLCAAGDCECLAAAGLAICEHRAVVPLEHTLYDRLGDLCEDLVLRRRIVQNAAEGEPPVLPLQGVLRGGGGGETRGSRGAPSSVAARQRV